MVRGGLLVEPNYNYVLQLDGPNMRVFGAKNPAAEMNIVFGWSICATSNSNTITIVSGGVLLGNGVGQQDRVGAAELAIKRAIDAGHRNQLFGSVAVSDSFFPNNDAVQTLIDAGVRCIFATSGSVNDANVIDLCRSSGVTLYMLPDALARGFFGH